MTAMLMAAVAAGFSVLGLVFTMLAVASRMEARLTRIEHEMADAIQRVREDAMAERRARREADARAQAMAKASPPPFRSCGCGCHEVWR